MTCFLTYLSIINSLFPAFLTNFLSISNPTTRISRNIATTNSPVLRLPPAISDRPPTIADSVKADAH